MQTHDMIRGPAPFLFADPTCKQDALDDIEATVFPRSEIRTKVVIQQIPVDKGLVLLVSRIGLHHRLEIPGIFS